MNKIQHKREIITAIVVLVIALTILIIARLFNISSLSSPIYIAIGLSSGIAIRSLVDVAMSIRREKGLRKRTE